MMLSCLEPYRTPNSSSELSLPCQLGLRIEKVDPTGTIFVISPFQAGKTPGQLDPTCICPQAQALFFFFPLRQSFSVYSGTHFVDQAGFELRNPPTSASRVLGLKACATTPDLGTGSLLKALIGHWSPMLTFPLP